MKAFYKDPMTIEEYNAKYKGKTMSEIQELEKKRFDENRPEIDAAHEKFVDESNDKMLTVGKLVAWLKDQDPNAHILAYEPNSDAFIEQLGKLPSYDICTVAKAKEHMAETLEGWYKGTPNPEEKVARDISIAFRYAKDSDVIIWFN